MRLPLSYSGHLLLFIYRGWQRTIPACRCCLPFIPQPRKLQFDNLSRSLQNVEMRQNTFASVRNLGDGLVSTQPRSQQLINSVGVTGLFSEIGGPEVRTVVITAAKCCPQTVSDARVWNLTAPSLSQMLTRPSVAMTVSSNEWLTTWNRTSIRQGLYDT